jgi:hypothetical protein
VLFVKEILIWSCVAEICIGFMKSSKALLTHAVRSHYAHL